jgi:hypothetical protein
MVWLDANRLGFLPATGAHPQAHIFDRSLRKLGGFDNCAASTSLLVGEVIVGVGKGRLTVADLPNGPTRVVHQLQSPQLFAMAALPGATQISPGPPEDTNLPVVPLATGAAGMVVLAVSSSSARHGEQAPMPRPRTERG